MWRLSKLNFFLVCDTFFSSRGYWNQEVFMTKDNSQYKDRLFTFLFGTKENRRWTLNLYNAVNGTHYTDPEAIEITTIREIMYLGMHNDVSFLISNEMNLYEQQSTFNPNMPLRMMEYLGHLYEKYIKQKKLNKYGTKLISLPAPKLIVFYNGITDQPDESILKLSDSFPAGAESDVEVQVQMLNINHGRNAELLQVCRPLGEYSWLVERIREYRTEINDGLESAVDRAIGDMPNSFEIRPFLEAHRAEVKGMLLEEYNEDEIRNLFKEEGRADEEGRLPRFFIMSGIGIL